MHALIIEQDTWIILMIEDALRALGYSTFDFADSPREAIAAASLRRPDLITAGLRLGTGTGVEAVREICSDEAIPVVFVTATPWEVRAIDPQAVILPKPFCQDALHEAVIRATSTAVMETPAGI
jgi:DNA-binding response OmpR family regulator